MKFVLPVALSRRAACVALALCAIASIDPGAAAGDPDTATYRAWIEEMKTSSRGPFSGIAWFCKDGTEIPSVPGKGFACADHGGGIQHGRWSENTRAIRGAGYAVANLLAGLDLQVLLDGAPEFATLKQILLEQYLVVADDGWILRGARHYRGALQAEDERRGARRLLRTMLQDRNWNTQRFALLREAARLLPHEAETVSVTEMRELSARIAEQDPGFASLRDKIHNLPSASDAGAVRGYVPGRTVSADTTAMYARLADSIDRVYRVEAAGMVETLARSTPDAALARALSVGLVGLGPGTDAQARLAASASLLVLVREQLNRFAAPGRMLDALDVSLALEVEAFRAANAIQPRLATASRRDRVAWLGHCIDALYGAGLLSHRERHALAQSIARLGGDVVPLPAYEDEVRYLERATQWSDRGLRFHFGETVRSWTGIEPLAARYFHDRLRGSPLLFFGAVIATLHNDANRLAGIRHRLFGETAGPGLRALNPGLTRGVLRFADGTPFDPQAIYVLPETLADLPPLAGILTAGAGNAVSHVQLLARNLGIPNVAVDAAVLNSLRRQAGQRVVLAVSPRGTVQLEHDGPEWDALIGIRQPATDVLIRPDAAKLDLSVVNPLALSALRSTDSGRLAGPKAANLAELKRLYPDAVADGVVIPFGVFRQLLEQPLDPGGPSVWTWMNREYQALGAGHADAAARRRAAGAFLARLRTWILSRQPDDAFTRQLRAAMEHTFGADGGYGVFVRSDTNVEDLPGFSGAGLNLTVPNVVGFDQVLEAIVRVWASPFTERAYGWRQAHMSDPAQVFPSVLLLRSVPVDKSGVMVTRDVDTGDPGQVSIATNEGIGGAVSDQAAEDLRVDLQTQEVRLLARATAPRKRVLGSAGGLDQVYASGADYVLNKQEIRVLVELARGLPERFPGAGGQAGGPPPAMDVEFGFLRGRLALFQIRPFAESKRAQRDTYLAGLDAERRPLTGRTVDMRDIP